MADTDAISGGGASSAARPTTTSSFRLLRLWCALVCVLAVVSTTSHQVFASAESKVDSDLVFDNLEQTDVNSHENHHRIARDVISEEIPLDSSPPVGEEHWLSSTVNRIKRSISSFLSKSPEGDSSNSGSHRTHHKVKRTRVPRQDPLGQQEAAEDDYDDEEYNEGNVEETETTVDAYNPEEDEEEEEEEYYDNGGEDYNNQDGDDDDDDDDDYGTIETGQPTRGDTYPTGQGTIPETTTPQLEVTPVTPTQDVSLPDIETTNIVPVTYGGVSRTGGDHSFNFNYNNTSYASGNRHNESQMGFDDEDLTAVNSGEGTSGDGEEIHHPLGVHPPTQNHPVYFRISFTVSEPFVDSFNDRNSYQYQDFTRDLIQDIENLYKDVPGTQSATVIRIEKREADTFTSKVTVDLGSVGFYNHQAIKDVLYKQIENHRRIGEHPTMPDDFHFRVFEAQTRVCQSHELRCHSGECVPAEARCNRVSDCSDNSDEVGCEHTATSTTPWSISPEVEINGGDFGSGDGEGRSIRPEHTKCRADDVVRCSDGSRTICADHVCDGKKDCDDGSDEDNCSNDCAEGEFICDISRCIPLSKRCDGVRDCSDDTDERECAQCRQDEMKCDNKCVRTEKRCDGVRDCNDGADERNCPPESQCRQGEFECGDGQCIHPAQRCDGRQDCRNGRDESNCTACALDEVRCDDGRCLRGKKCDGIFDCVDGSDEHNCPTCRLDEFSCNDGRCVPEHLRCDGVPHCSDSSDEQNCVQHCPSDQFRCSNGVCLQDVRRCDGYPDCPDASDEDGCPGSGAQNRTCTAEQFDCGDNCIDITYRCDKYEDCIDGRDERGCSNLCSADQFECINDKSCISSSLTCDGNDDCNDGSDEIDCPPSVNECTSNEFRCDDGSCIPSYLRCSGRAECSDGSDERECPCRADQFPCLNGQCIAGNLRCNRRNDCSDGSDEHNCPTELPPIVPEPTSPTRPPPPLPISCPEGYQPCYTGNKCILRAQLCDGRVDCNDMSDETNCPTTTDRGCSVGQFRCENGPCISEELRCNGKVDCPRDSSDELDCPERPSRFPGSSEGLNLRTYPNAQEIKENIYKPDREVVFQCRDEGPFRARVRWTRPNGEPLPPGSRDLNGRLEMPNIKVEHSGTYVCEAVGYPPNTPGAQVNVNLQVDRWIPPPTRPPTACGLQQATCSNGDCISKHLVCDGKYDCTDGSDESRCNPNGCEPNEFRCANKKCVLKTWRCDADDDCGDNSDEESCATNPPGSLCQYHQFACHSNNQCIPRSYHCDLERDCVDGSDEIGCSKPVISVSPPPMVTLDYGSVFEITCTAVGVPTPEISWRLNWGHIPPKCRTTSSNGFGSLSCPNIQTEDQGAYSCEAINIKGSTFAIPDTILVVSKNAVCPPGFFNEEARTETDCIKCFCFGQSTKCRSADLFIYQFQPPFDTLKVLGVRVDPITGVVEIRDEPIYRNALPQNSPVGRSGVHSQLPPYAELNQNNLVPYFAMPENYHGNQLKSYGGHLKYNVLHHNRGYPSLGPAVILTGNGYTLMHQSTRPVQPNREETISVRFFVGEWVKKTDAYPEQLATREEIMMTLADVSNILIKLQYNEGILNTTISNIEMESAAAPNSGLGPASYVEECECPVGYTGTSCERCADGYVRHKSGGQWLGRCFKELPETCPPGTYGDPNRGIPCEICPCPLTNPSNQFGRTCSLEQDGEVTCDCPPGYVGRRCEQCAQGYSGNPLIPGDYCRISEYCHSDGAISAVGDDQGRCQCKDYVDGPTCNTCKPNTFHLSSENQFGCIACFCMGITRQCTSSNWYRDQVTTAFTSSRNEFKLIDTLQRERPIEQGITLNQNQREIVYSNFASSNVHYWSLPSRYLGNKISSYGGYLRYTLRYVPLPGGQSSRNSAADVELVSANQINLLYFAREQAQPTGTPQTFSVPLLEQHWQRSDGQRADREHLLMALADLEAIYIKATYNTNTRETALISVSLDIADERNTGSTERALAVEQCSCPVGYKGLSCEDCDVGYARGDGGLYLGLCEACQCNGNSNECDPETGTCFNCDNHTTGENCERCLPGYEGDPMNRVPCRFIGGPSPVPCECDPRGSISSECYNGQCQCKPNVEGYSCNRCRGGTFGLNSSSIDGCQVCFCSGVATECSESNLYIEQIPSQIIDPERHGFTLTDQYQRGRITNGFQLNIAMNEIGYTFRPSSAERWYWSLPRDFTGNQIKSYGGKLEFTQRYTQRPQARYIPDQDVIITGNGVTIYWTNPEPQIPDIENKVTVTLGTGSNWQRLDQNQGPRPASREDIITALANIQSILIRAQPSSDTSSAYLSDLTLDTAVVQYTGQPKAVDVEACRCPPGYRGTSCESCDTGFYRDVNDFRTGPLGSCSRCPCNNNQQSCSLGPDNRVACSCLPGYTGRNCEFTDDGSSQVTTPGPRTTTAAPPTIEVVIIAPKIEIYEVGSTLRFNCSARPLRAPTPVQIHWSKDGGNLPSHAIDDGRGILVITNLKVSDSGRYICEAYDGYSIVTKDISVNVGTSLPQPPRVAISPPYVDVQEGQPIEIHCAASGNPQPTLRLIRLDGQQLNPSHYFENGLFRIQQAQKSDEGSYQCIATNPAGTHTSNVEIFVRERDVASNVRVEISPAYFNGRTGETVMLRCKTSGTASSIKWSKQGGPLPYSSREDNGDLTIYQARQEDSGVYVCTVTTFSGISGSETAEVRITGSDEGVYPTATVVPERITISQGSTTELRCEASGVPAPAIKWTKLGSELSPNSEQIGPVLHIRNAQVSDRGVYICVSSNSHGLAQASTMVEVNRLEVPILSIHPQPSQTVTAGNSAILQCRVDAGIPSPALTWTRPNGLPLGANVETMSGGTLRFTQITPNEGGEYHCVAVNEAGRSTAIANIVVQTPPQVYTIPGEDVITHRIGDFVKLECHGTGIPQPSVEWSKYQPLRTEDIGVPYGAALVKNVAVHEIARLQQQDEGLYICRASNEAGVVEKRVQLVIESLPTRGDGGDDSTNGDNEVNPDFKDNERPRPPYPPGPTPPVHSYDETFTAPVGTRAELRCQINNNYDPEPLFVNWARADNSSLPSEAFVRSGTLYIDNVQPSAAGDYRCLGSSQSTGQIVFSLTTHLEVISPPRITLTPQRQVVHPGDNAYIQCSATGQQPIRISWSPMGRTMPASVNTVEGFIQFNNIQLSDAGRYRCTAVNSAGEADAVADVIVEENIHKPVLTAENRQQKAPVGSSVTLRCRAQDANVQNNIRWFRERLPLPQNSRVNGEYLHIFNLQQNDEGRYYCEIPTASGSSSDYIDLQVSYQRWYCSPDQWHCVNHHCIPQSQHCDGIDNCGDNSDEEDCNNPRTRRGPSTVTAPSAPTLYVTPSDGTHRSGENIEVNCQSSEPGVIATWTKLSGWSADNVRVSGGNLKITSVRPENSGVYRCEANGHQGVYHKDYTLNVIDEDNAQDEPPMDIKTAPQGSTVVMNCSTDLPPPVTYTWKKQGGNLPNNVDMFSRTILLNDVSSSDAGTYICSASNGRKTNDIPTVLIVTGIVPYFSQAPTSYIELPTLSDAYIHFNFEVSFKPQNSEGLILYNGNKGGDRTGDFISLSLVNAVPEFRFYLGHSVTVIKADRPISLDQWHTVKVIRNRKKVTMYVDGEGPYIGNAEGKFIGLDLSEPLYLGGVPNVRDTSPEANYSMGFVGCISRLKIGHTFHDVMKEAIRKQSITTCETCSENRCEHKGVCQEALSTEGYTCICPAGYSGTTCNKLKGEACSPYACNTGRCVDTENSFQCMCPLGTSGRRCERQVSIMEPAFSNDAYIAYETPKPQRRLKVSLKVKPNDLNDGVLLYCGETDEGHGDFASLAIKDRHLEFRFDVGNGPTVIRSNKEVQQGEWYVLTATRSLSEGRLVVNGDLVVGRSPGNHKALNLLTPLYIGGFDKQNIKINEGVGVNSGFNGCISDINVSGLDLHIVQSVTDSANVEDCSASSNDVDNNIDSPQYAHENQPSPSQPSPYDRKRTGCSNRPCKNNGQCYPLSPVDYKCSCQPGFTGQDCDIEINICEQLIPCQNGGSCISNTSSYECSCPLGYSGQNCELRIQLRNDVQFDGRGYLEFDRSYLNHSKDDVEETIALELSTNSSNGLIFWHGQSPNEDGTGQDFVSLGIVNGYVEFSYDLGSGPVLIRNNYIRVNDGQRHSVILKRTGAEGSIEIDRLYDERGTAQGLTTSLNCNGNIYLGGAPNIDLMSGGRFLQGFSGCIHQFELQNSNGIDLSKAISGINAKPCSSFNNDIRENNLWDENDLIN